jgi:hypothetical protein
MHYWYMSQSVRIMEEHSTESTDTLDYSILRIGNDREVQQAYRFKGIERSGEMLRLPAVGWFK